MEEGIMYIISLVFHILGVAVCVGSVTFVDYLHIIGLRKRSLESKFIRIYPYVSKLINAGIIVILLSGIIMLIQKPELLASNLFRFKMALFAIVILNGIYLQKVVSPGINKCVLEGQKNCTQEILYSSSISGSISIVTWYSLVVLSITKVLQYKWYEFLSVYLLIIICAIYVAIYMEKRARKWNVEKKEISTKKKDKKS
ncbi:MAG: hypothetical protein ACI83O_000811 [Patescibacteria group bacterium]|jgi:hypothetical protein